ncbi:ThuA domain-containing protein [Sphingomonas sp. HF-S3]|uniref:ThuA domain-containing protein n=1 Tax=Sphingomonas rustica TaxID=3103142 RepID=A0ABV0BA12_9SPHN
MRGAALALAASLAATIVPAAAQQAPVQTQATTRPDARRAVLIFTKTAAFRHDSIPDAVRALSDLAEKRGWRAVASEDSALFTPDSLARFDVIVFASATGDLLSAEQRQAFESWLAAGHGFVALHGAGDGSHPDWYSRMIGTGPYTGHPGGADQFQTGNLILLDRTHPATRHLPRRWRWTEEYYAYASPPRADAHILARLDETGMRFEPKQVMGDRHALIWWRCEGRGRIFYSALGHRGETWRDPAHVRMLDGALAWAGRKAGKGC